MSRASSTAWVTLVAMSRADLPQVVAIDAASSLRPWPVATFRTELARDDRRYLVAREDGAGVAGDTSAAGVVGGAGGAASAGVAASASGADGEVVGFAGVALLGDQAHVMTVAVDPQRQGRGIGARLVTGLLAEVARAGITASTLEVRVSNGPARRLYGRAGFAEAGVRPAYYPDGEDAVIMWRTAATEGS